jgi:hypothetical protein
MKSDDIHSIASRQQRRTFAARTSERAAVSSRPASADSPGVDEYSPLPEGLLHNRDANDRATVHLLLGNDEDIDRYTEAAQRAPQTNGLLHRISD